MIIAGYPGIGKSSVAKLFLRVIDLESSCMIHYKNDMINWTIPYISIAQNLSDQGYIVFVSTHQEVIFKLEQFKELAYVIYPSLELKKEWIDKLNNRQKESSSIKDYRAYERAANHYRDDILYLSNSKLKKVQLDSMDYDLVEIIGQIKEETK